MIQAITPDDVRHLYEICPDGLGLSDVRYQRYVRLQKARLENDRLWTLMIATIQPARVSVESVGLWKEKYPSAFRLALQRVNDGQMVIAEA